MTSLEQLAATLKIFGMQGVHALRHDVERVSATGKTADSIRFEIEISSSGNITLTFYGRQYFKALETGRGPRKNSTYQEYDLSLLEYMQAKGIGADLPEKKRKQLAKFLAYRINRDGDEVFKSGGRVVYTPTLTKLVSEIKRAIVSDFIKFNLRNILKN
jgi:hypothetical protein